MKEYLLGIDIGTSAVKAAVFDPDGNPAAETLEAYETYYPAPGYAEQDPEDWWSAVCKAVRRITDTVNPGEIAAVGIDGQGWAAVAVDSGGNPLCRTPIWTDTRSAAECDEIRSVMSEDRWFGICRNPIQPGYSLPKVLWYKNHRPEILSKAEYILQSNSFIGLRLTGEASQDVSQGYAYHFFDMEKRCWDEAAVSELGLPARLFPKPVSCSEVIGAVTAQAARETGLCEGIPVVAGGLDAACAALGAGAVVPGSTQEQSGQAGGMSICTDRSAGDPRLIMGCHTVPGMWLLQGGTTGGAGALRWLRRSVCPGLTYSQMDDEASRVPAGSEGLIFLPYLAGERSPLWNPDAKGVFYGLTFAHTRAHIIRSVLEGVAFSLRHNIETAEKAGAPVGLMRSAGGSSVSRVWTQIKSDVTGKQIEVPGGNCSSVLGAAILAGTGAGIFSSEAEAALKSLKAGRLHSPDPGNAGIYDKTYGRYIEIYERLRPVMREETN